MPDENSAPVRERPRRRRGQRYDAGPLEELPLGRFRIVELPLGAVGLLRTAGGSVHAVRNRCPHMGAPICRGHVGGTAVPSEPDEIRWGMAGEVLRCPWHGFEFNIASGENLFGITRARLRKYEVQIDHGRVYVIG
jgi:nitrite reductase/ring-hydroxylating ferredoxin subunit